MKKKRALDWRKRTAGKEYSFSQMNDVSVIP